MNIQLLGISNDQPFSQKAFSKNLGLIFPLLSDRDTKVIKKYGVYNRKLDAAARSYFLVGMDGKILWTHVMEDSRQKLSNEDILKRIQGLVQ